jgi:hypothetical protein
MSRRHLIKKYKVFDNADTTTNPESLITEIAQVDNITYQIIIDSTVDAEIQVKYCNDDFISGSSVFTDLDFGSPLMLDGSSDTDGLIHIQNKGFKFLRLSIVNNGGTGDITAFVTGTGIGA